MSETKISHRALLMARVEGSDRPTERVAVCLSPRLSREWVQAREQFEQLANGDEVRGSLASSPLGKARKAMEAAEKAARDASVNVVLQALPEAEFRAHMAEWQEMDEAEKRSDLPLLRKCIVAVETMDGGESDLTVVELLDHIGDGLTGGESGRLGIVALNLCQSTPEVPSSALR